jgi:hypothetical protein
MLETSKECLDLIGTRTDDPRWRAIETRYGLSTDRMQLIHGFGRLLVRPAGLFIYLFKLLRGKPSALEVMGVEFFAASVRDGARFKGDLPYSLDWNDSRAAVRKRFGAPEAKPSSPDFDSWMIDDRRLGVSFRKTDTSIKNVSVTLDSDVVLARWREAEQKPASVSAAKK